eukprot:3631862-Prymnesium_polylepis.1
MRCALSRAYPNAAIPLGGDGPFDFRVRLIEVELRAGRSILRVLWFDGGFVGVANVGPVVVVTLVHELSDTGAACRSCIGVEPCVCAVCGGGEGVAQRPTPDCVRLGTLGLDAMGLALCGSVHSMWL